MISLCTFVVIDLVKSYCLQFKPLYHALTLHYNTLCYILKTRIKSSSVIGTKCVHFKLLISAIPVVSPKSHSFIMTSFYSLIMPNIVLHAHRVIQAHIMLSKVFVCLAHDDHPHVLFPCSVRVFSKTLCCGCFCTSTI